MQKTSFKFILIMQNGKYKSVPGLDNTTSVSLATLASRKPKIHSTVVKHHCFNSGKADIEITNIKRCQCNFLFKFISSSWTQITVKNSVLRAKCPQHQSVSHFPQHEAATIYCYSPWMGYHTTLIHHRLPQHFVRLP